MARPKTITDALLGEVRDIVAAKRGATVQELCDEFASRTGVKVCTVTMYRAIKRAGLQRVKTRQLRAASQPRRYGYTQVHRATPTPATADQYASSLTDAEWALTADLFEAPEGGRGRPTKYERRTMVDACCYVLRTGCAWTMLPKSFPPWLAVHNSFSRWAAQGKFEQLQQRLFAQWRQRLGRNAEPSAMVIDSQANRISPQGGASGYDAGKKVKGRKRHIVTDTAGLLLAVSITAASVQDRDGAPPGCCPGLRQVRVHRTAVRRLRLRRQVRRAAATRQQHCRPSRAPPWRLRRMGRPAAVAVHACPSRWLCHPAQALGGRTHSRMAGA